MSLSINLILILTVFWFVGFCEKPLIFSFSGNSQNLYLSNCLSSTKWLTQSPALLRNVVAITVTLSKAMNIVLSTRARDFHYHRHGELQSLALHSLLEVTAWKPSSSPLEFREVVPSRGNECLSFWFVLANRHTYKRQDFLLSLTWQKTLSCAWLEWADRDQTLNHCSHQWIIPHRLCNSHTYIQGGQSFFILPNAAWGPPSLKSFLLLLHTLLCYCYES